MIHRLLIFFLRGCEINTVYTAWKAKIQEKAKDDVTLHPNQ